MLSAISWPTQGRPPLELRDALAEGPRDDEARLRAELQATDRLVDLVLFLYHGLDKDEMDRLETARTG